ESNTLISVRSLSSSFSADSDLASLSYAESYSLVEFILDQYGEEKMTQLIDIFTEGAYYDDALQ
ncbi:MAG: peptidase MA domain-containing protein, partial [Anaerolineae bacterium]|nr:peptidase MA domain-containing protein [Anaerolineae bacterium]